MHFVYPQDMLRPRSPDELFREEAHALRDSGHILSLVDFDALASDRAAIRPPVGQEAAVVYRGWMFTPKRYQNFVQSVLEEGGKLFTSPDQYLSAHYLPNWYPLLADLTPETAILDPSSDLVPVLEQLGWPRFFVKDYVKSLKTAGGSVIERPQEIGRVMEEMRKYRGMIEGGLCVRRYEEFLPGSERRYFVLCGVSYAPEPGWEVPEIVRECARRLSSPFISVDVATRSDGVERVVEVGDGQVSDLVGWPIERFVLLWREADKQGVGDTGLLSPAA